MPQTKSPLRYPGGKSQLWKFVKSTIEQNGIESPIYCEPFAGGSGITWELLLGGHIESAIINDYDPAIYSFWNACLNNTDELIQMIANTPITLDEWHKQKEIYATVGRDPESIQGAFATFFLNRTNVSGIISGGPIGGQKQKGKYLIDCRFTKETSIKKIKKIAEHKNQVQLYNLDATKLIPILKSTYSPKRLFTFFDPPYYKQGQSLYLSSFDHKQHENMHNYILDMYDFHWILTYDKAPQISEMYQDVENSYEYQLNYSANKKTKATELIFASPITHIESSEKIQLL